MPYLILILIALCISCANVEKQQNNEIDANDSITLMKMVLERESAMIRKDLPVIVEQFDSLATFINGGGFYYAGIAEITKFHQSMFENDSLTYTFQTGNAFVNAVAKNVALVYYPWKQQWTMKRILSDTLNETGLMTIIAVKEKNTWKWKSMTNQRTKEFFIDLRQHKANH